MATNKIPQNIFNSDIFTDCVGSTTEAIFSVCLTVHRGRGGVPQSSHRFCQWGGEYPSQPGTPPSWPRQGNLPAILTPPLPLLALPYPYQPLPIPTRCPSPQLAPTPCLPLPLFNASVAFTAKL